MVTKYTKRIYYNGVKFLVIPGFLLLLWIILSLFLSARVSFSVIENDFGVQNFTTFTAQRLLKNQTVSAYFRAEHNNLGAVRVRFNTFHAISNDYVMFRIKKRGEENWFYENRYKVDQFQPDELFPFGFPIIHDSSGKEYSFEITSTKGKVDDAVAISPQFPIFVTDYQFTTHELASNPRLSIWFLTEKLLSGFQTVDMSIVSLIYLLPFFLYMFLILSRKYVSRERIRQLWFLPSSEYLSFVLYFVMLLSNNFFTTVSNGYTSIVMLLLWIALVIWYKLDSTVSFLIAFWFLLFCPFLLLVNQELTAEKMALWVYFFLVTGVVEAILEITGRIRYKVGYKQFLNEMIGTINTSSLRKGMQRVFQ